MNTVLSLSFLLVLLGFIWGFWLVFRKNMNQPVGVIMYFIGAVLAVLIAMFVTVRIFPGIAVRFLDMANESSDVQTLQQRTDQVFGSEGTVTQPTAPTSPVAAPIGGGEQGFVVVTPAPGQQAYIIQPGETLSSIGRKFGVTAKQLQDANKITNPNNIKAGQKLIIPKP
jgi:nucleoid-associated protein YgaU